MGCGRKAPQDELLRFVAHDGLLAVGGGEPGRGAYTCPRLACFERAASKNAFSRALRETVRIDQNAYRFMTSRLHGDSGRPARSVDAVSPRTGSTLDD